MLVTVKLFGTLRRLACPETPGIWRGEIPEGMTVRELIVFLGTCEEEVANAAINGIVCDLGTKISEESIIVLVTPVGGG
jgi:sulfur carrier protein ThiS